VDLLAVGIQVAEGEQKVLVVLLEGVEEPILVAAAAVGPP